MKTKFKYLIFTAILLMISSIVVIELSGLKMHKFRPLEGFSTEYMRPEFSLKNWMNGRFQDSMMIYKDNNLFLREPLIRLYNEYNFSFFKTTKAPETVIGKNNECLQIDYIREYTGEYFIGEDLIRERCLRLKYLQDTLNKLGKELILVFTPGKASFMPENIPDHFTKKMNEETNYGCFTKICKEMNINYLDLQNYFSCIKDTVSWPLYPTYGIHWSDYGMTLALDTFINYTTNLTGKNIPKPKIKKIETSNIPRGQDDDMAKVLNLLFDRHNQTLAYPQFEFSDTSKKEINALFIGDSFLFHWFKYDLGSFLFKKYNFWYYNVMVYPEYYNSKLMNYSLNIKDEILSRDVIVLECTERFLYTAFWNFEEISYKIFNDDYEPDALMYHSNDITKDHERWLLVWDEAQKTGKTMQQCLYENANKLAIKLKPGTVEFYEHTIRNSPDWLNSIKKQAQEQGVPLDEMINRNAVWMAEQEKNK
jgi:hypothetical protein